MTTSTTAPNFQVTFSIYGANPTPAWRRAITASVLVHAESAEQAREIAGHGDATWSVSAL